MEVNTYLNVKKKLEQFAGAFLSAEIPLGHLPEMLTKKCFLIAPWFPSHENTQHLPAAYGTGRAYASNWPKAAAPLPSKNGRKRCSWRQGTHAWSVEQRRDYWLGGREPQLKGNWGTSSPAKSAEVKAPELVSKTFHFGCFSRGAFGHWLSQLSFYPSPRIEGFLCQALRKARS